MIDEHGRFIVQTTNEPGELFSVVQYYSNANWEYLVERVPVKVAFDRFKSATESVGAKMGLIAEVKIVDIKTESLCAAWEFGKGITFPTRDDCAKMAAGQ